jgi:hypothetical protein
MAPLFRPWANTFFRVSLAVLVGGVATLIGSLMVYARTPFATGQQDPVDQPVPFDHRHHVGDDRIDCRFCHTLVERSAIAGIPSTATCMGCHAQVWNKSPVLALVRESYFTDRPIPWVRVHRLPDFVYFNHAIHVAKGVGCVTCHGRVDRMAAVSQVATLTMGFCLDCHREPEKHLRPREEVLSLAWEPDEAPAVLGARLKAQYDVRPRTSCTACHR